jgi:hypothetical protein
VYNFYYLLQFSNIIRSFASHAMSVFRILTELPLPYRSCTELYIVFWILFILVFELGPIALRYGLSMAVVSTDIQMAANYSCF